jgi:hypothetical protein
MPVALSFEDWERAGHRLSGIVDSTAWCLGDWLIYGKQHYADRYKKAIRAAGLGYQTLRNYAWVSARFELGRRRPRLSFQHHAEVASLPLPEQDRWLDRVEQEMWTTKELRTRVQTERDHHGAGEPGKSLVIPRIQVPGGRLVWWRKAAVESGMEFENWVMVTLDGAAEQTLGEELTAGGQEGPAQRPA